MNGSYDSSPTKSRRGRDKEGGGSGFKAEILMIIYVFSTHVKSILTMQKENSRSCTTLREE